jgi:hypothetical protein
MRLRLTVLARIIDDEAMYKELAKAVRVADIKPLLRCNDERLTGIEAQRLIRSKLNISITEKLEQ